MKIACLGWGSLIWDPRGLPVQPKWSTDGPFLPVEFARQSSDGRITLVIDAKASPVQVLWSQMLSPDLLGAKKALRDREGIRGGRWESRIGSWQKGKAAPANIPDLPAWAEAHNFDAIIWTALGPKFHNENRVPSGEEVIEYLRGLAGTQREDAKRYIECAPRQIETEYRRRIAAALGWSYKAC